MPMKNEIFVDTSGWMGFFVSDEPIFPQCRQIIEQSIARRVGLVTTNYVLTELVPLLSTRTRLTRPQILSLLASLESIGELEIVHITPEIHQSAFDLLQKRPDKNWSWVDAASFVVMQSRALTQALTTDHHFDQAGFERLIG